MIYIVIFVVCFILLCLIDAVLEEKKLQVTKYELVTDKRISKTKIVILSDLHNKQYPNNNQILYEKIKTYQPDLILVAGDMITELEPVSKSIGYELCEGLAQKYPVYYVYGNHEQAKEQYDNEQMLRFRENLTNKGVTFVNNRSVLFKDQIMISGITLPIDCYHHYHHKKMTTDELTQMLDIKNSEAYHILLCHTPEYMKEYFEFHPDLVVSGHYHGGLIRLPFIGGIITPQFQLFPKYNGGKYQYQNKDIIVSRGLGNHRFKLRFLNKPELIFTTINTK